MTETSSKIFLESGKRSLQKCHICDNEFNKHELELHFLTSHTDLGENDDYDQQTLEEPGFETNLITNDDSDDKSFDLEYDKNGKYQERNLHRQISNILVNEDNDDKSELQNGLNFESEINLNVANDVLPFPENHLEISEKYQERILYGHNSCTLIKEEDIVHEKKSFECDNCKKVFSRKGSLQNHISCIHGGSKNFQCKICQKVFCTKSAKRTHTKTIHEDEKIHKCDSCHYACNQKGNLSKHIKTVDCQNRKTKICKAQKVLKCESCGKLFSQAEILKRHKHTVHEGHKYYKCELCEKSFSSAPILKRHIHQLHEGHKDYKCELCGKS